MLEGRILSTMIFIFAIIFSVALILVIRDNITNEKKGLNPQIAMVVGLSIAFLDYKEKNNARRTYIKYYDFYLCNHFHNCTDLGYQR